MARGYLLENDDRSVTIQTDGTAGSPAITFASDPDTGIFLQGTDSLSITCGGVEVIRSNTTATAVNSFLFTPAASGSSPEISTNGTDADIDLTFSSKGSGTINFGNTTKFGNLQLTDNTISSTNTNGDILLSPNGTGKVGIGTTSPGSLLDVRDSTNSGTTLVIGGDTVDQDRNIRLLETNIAEANGFRGGFIQYNGVSNRLLIGVHNLQTTSTSDDNSIIAINRSTGNLGIGIGFTSPSTNLHIQETNTDTIPVVEIEQLSTGDAGLQFSIVGDAYAIGIDNSDADKFKISYATGAGTAVLGTNDRLVIDATGTLSFAMGTGTDQAQASGKANVNTTAAGTPASTVETDLITYSLPANSLSADGKIVKITAWGTSAANTNDKTIRLYFGATVVRQLGTAAFNNQDWIAEAIVVRTGASTQDSIGTEMSNNNNVFLTHAEPAEDTTTATTIRITGQNLVAAANDIVAEGMLVEYLN